MRIAVQGDVARIALQNSLFAICDAKQIEVPLNVSFRDGTYRQFRVIDLTWFAHREKQLTYVIARPGPQGRQIGVRLHRLLTQAKPMQIVDHRDRDGLNNLASNLRVCGNSQNVAWAMLPRGRYPRGVSYIANLNRYRAKITVNYRSIHLGLFDDPVSAASAYDAAAIHFFGEFARCNNL